MFVILNGVGQAGGKRGDTRIVTNRRARVKEKMRIDVAAPYSKRASRKAAKTQRNLACEPSLRLCGFARDCYK
jgi:hypothetical protein